VVEVEREQRLHVDDLDLDPDLGEQVGRGLGDTAAGTVRHEGHVASRAQHLRLTERDRELGQVLGQRLTQAVPVQHFDHQRRVVALQERVVEAGTRGSCHGARPRACRAART
jgi:hypothetical protein